MNNEFISIDLGISSIASIYSSKGECFKYQTKRMKSLEKNKDKIKSLRDRKKKYSKNWNKLNKTLKKKQKKITNKRNDYLHKASKHIINYCLKENIDNIIIGDIETKKLVTKKEEFKELNFNSDIQALLLSHLKYGEGLIIISGPTGSGKTTTLYNMINEINKSEESIVTIEDPIEYKIDGISQIPVYGNTQIDFKTAMKYILRQDPNVILIGEIRDEDTAKMVQRISLTGHIVLTSIHAQSISSAIRRICELGCDYKMIIESLNFVTNQRLIRKLCPYCKKTHYTTEDENELLSINESIVIYDSIGCDKCNQTGFIGRIAVHEVAIFDNESKAKLLKGGDIEDVIEHIDDKMKSTIYDEALNLVKKGKTTITELKRLGIFK